MKTFWRFLYNFLIFPLFFIAANIVSIFNKKIRRGIDARKNLFEKLNSSASQLHGRKRIWIHSSSMGEFEQAKPIIAAIKSKYPNADIIVSFFSPSGYEPSKKFKLASLITYIPFDTHGNAVKFLDIIKPDVAVFMRYDMWPNHIWECGKRNIPIILANASLGKKLNNRYLFTRSFLYSFYREVTNILAINNIQAEGYKRLFPTLRNIEVIGETRYDQVWTRSREAKTKHLIPESISASRQIIVAGSSWYEDEEVILPAFRMLLEKLPSALLILVPHEPTIQTLQRLEETLDDIRTIRFSSLADYKNENVIIVDSIGILMTLYHYAAIAYVGGSFKQGIHNVLEPAVYEIPVIFGPKHKNSAEASELLNRNAARVVDNADECYETIKMYLFDESVRKNAGKEALKLVQENLGATDRCLKYLSKFLEE